MGTHYMVRWMESASSVLVIAAAVMAFRDAVIYLDILPKAKPAPAKKPADTGPTKVPGIAVSGAQNYPSTGMKNSTAARYGFISGVGSSVTMAVRSAGI